MPNMSASLGGAAGYDMQGLLSYAIANGMIDLPSIEEAMNMAERKRYLDMHPYEIWESNDGRFCTCIPDEKKESGRAIRRRKSRKEIEDVIINYWKEKIESPTVDDVFTEWNDRRLNLKKISGATHTRYKQTYDRFYAEFGKHKIKSLLPTDFEDFLEEQIPKFELNAKSFSGLKGITKGFLLRAKKRNLITWNVIDMFTEMDVSDKEFSNTVHEDEEEVYFDDEMDAMLSYCQQHQDSKNLGVALMFATGLRVGELVALKHSDFDGMVVDIKRSETTYTDPETKKRVVAIQDKTKTKAGTREVVIPEKYRWIVEKLRLCNPFGEYVFTNEQGERMNTNIIRKRVKKLCKKLGIMNKSPHKIRKTYGSILLDNNVDHKLIEKQMGHTDILTTEIHYHRDRKRIGQKMAILNSIPEFATN